MYQVNDFHLGLGGKEKDCKGKTRDGINKVGRAEALSAKGNSEIRSQVKGHPNGGKDAVQTLTRKHHTY